MHCFNVIGEIPESDSLEIESAHKAYTTLSIWNGSIGDSQK